MYRTDNITTDTSGMICFSLSVILPVILHIHGTLHVSNFSCGCWYSFIFFFQSDIIHQSALELIHSEDREEFKSQLNWRSQLGQDQQDMSLQQMALPGK